MSVGYGSGRARRGRRVVVVSVMDRCCRCRRRFPRAVLIAWSDGLWCAECAGAALRVDQHGDDVTLRRELREINADRADAHAEEARARSGENVVRGSSEADV